MTDNEKVLLMALKDAVELAADGWAYASEYFWDKYRIRDEMKALFEIEYRFAEEYAELGFPLRPQEEFVAFLEKNKD